MGGGGYTFLKLTCRLGDSRILRGNHGCWHSKSTLLLLRELLLVHQGAVVCILKLRDSLLLLLVLLHFLTPLNQLLLKG